MRCLSREFARAPWVYPPMFHACLMGRRGHLGSEACCSRCCPPPPPKSLLPSKVLFSTQLLSKSLAPLLLLLLLPLLLRTDEAGFFFLLHCCLRPLLHKTPGRREGRKGRGVVCVRGGRKERKRRAETNAKERRSLPPLPYTDNYVLHIACVRRRRCKPDQNYPSPPLPPLKTPGKRVSYFCEKKKMRRIAQLMKTLCVKYNKGVWTIKKGTPKRDIFHYHGFALSIPQFIVNQFFCLSVHRNRPAPFSCHPW